MDGLMMHIPGKPWDTCTTKFDEPIKTTEDLIRQSGFDYNVSMQPMTTEREPNMKGWSAIYREDTKNRIAVVNRQNPVLVQNRDAFQPVASLIGDKLEVESFGHMNNGRQVFGCFKFVEPAKVFDDDIETYAVVINDHSKSDGKVMILTSPIRVWCQNMLAGLASTSTFKCRVAINASAGERFTITDILMDSMRCTLNQIRRKSETLVVNKVSREQMDTILDTLFPIPDNPDQEKAIETAEMQRVTFLDQCMGADNLANYRGTSFQVYNALVDYAQHYFKNPDKGMDTTYRMSMIPGSGLAVETPMNLVPKYLKLQNKMFA